MFPNLIIIGAPRCGTTSLHYYLGLHPEIYMSRVKELNFFIKEKNWRKGFRWYESHFTEKVNIRGESSTMYAAYPSYTGVPSRIYAALPDVKFIYLIRDPIDRIVSHYLHLYSVGKENRPLSEALKNFNNNVYLNCSRYAMQIDQYLCFFKKESIFISTTEELRFRREAVMSSIFNFLGIDNSYDSGRYSRIMHSSGKKRRLKHIGWFIKRLSKSEHFQKLPILFREWGAYLYYPFSKAIEPPRLDPEQKKDLIEYFKKDVERLRSTFACKCDGWCM